MKAALVIAILTTFVGIPPAWADPAKIPDRDGAFGRIGFGMGGIVATYDPGDVRIIGVGSSVELIGGWHISPMWVVFAGISLDAAEDPIVSAKELQTEVGGAMGMTTGLNVGALVIDPSGLKGSVSAVLTDLSLSVHEGADTPRDGVTGMGIRVSGGFQRFYWETVGFDLCAHFTVATAVGDASGDPDAYEWTAYAGGLTMGVVYD